MSAGMEYTLKPIGQQPVVWNVIDQLTQAMTMGKLRPGDKIPTETELSESLQVSRNSVREAVKILVAYGILEIRRAEGTFIRQRSFPTDAQSADLRHYVHAGRLLPPAEGVSPDD